MPSYLLCISLLSNSVAVHLLMAIVVVDYTQRVIEVPANVLVNISIVKSSGSGSVCSNSERVPLGVARGESGEFIKKQRRDENKIIPCGVLAANLLIFDVFFVRLESNNGIKAPSLQTPQTEGTVGFVSQYMDLCTHTTFIWPYGLAESTISDYLNE